MRSRWLKMDSAFARSRGYATRSAPILPIADLSRGAPWRRSRLFDFCQEPAAAVSLRADLFQRLFNFLIDLSMRRLWKSRRDDSHS